MKVEYLKNLVEYHNLNPTDLAKINLLEKKIGFPFPIAFKEFLYLTGEDYDMLLRGGGGMPQNIDKLPTINSIANDILKNCNTTIDNFFPFLEYVDQFLFFFIHEGDNPPVYRFEKELYYCGDDYIPNASSWGLPKGILKVADSFTEMIELAIASTTQ
jgi:hypothetical protein